MYYTVYDILYMINHIYSLGCDIICILDNHKTHKVSWKALELTETREDN